MPSFPSSPWVIYKVRILLFLDMESEAQLDRQQKAAAGPTVQSWEENAWGYISQTFFYLGYRRPALDFSLYSNLQQPWKTSFFFFPIWFSSLRIPSGKNVGHLPVEATVEKWDQCKKEVWAQALLIIGTAHPLTIISDFPSWNTMLSSLFEEHTFERECWPSEADVKRSPAGGMWILPSLWGGLSLDWWWWSAHPYMCQARAEQRRVFCWECLVPGRVCTNRMLRWFIYIERARTTLKWPYNILCPQDILIITDLYSERLPQHFYLAGLLLQKTFSKIIVPSSWSHEISFWDSSFPL